MSKARDSHAPSDQAERDLALDPGRSVLVQAPAGSGKTTLLTERFLTLLREVDEPGQVVAITFTNAAAAEMRNRILDHLRAAEPTPVARKVMERSDERDWRLLDLPAQLRITTIDSFCRELALQQPLLSSLGGGLSIAEQPTELYRRAARLTVEQIGAGDGGEVAEAVDTLLEWRDNNWQELETLLVEMLSKRDRWMQDFVLSKSADWDALRMRLEHPFAHAVRATLVRASTLLDHVPGACEEAMLLARFACEQPFGDQHRGLAEMAEFPAAPFVNEELENAHQAMVCLSNLVLTKSFSFRQRFDKNHGFPTESKSEKARLTNLIQRMGEVPGLEAALGAVCELPPLRYTEDDWKIVRACFTLLRHAAGQLKVVFAEAGAVDFTEVSQMALHVLKAEDGYPSEAAVAVADGIHHLLVDEFQDTSRRQHELLASLIAAWPEREGRTLFAVGDPMQSIYFFRDADAELFPRVKKLGLEIPNAEPFLLDFVRLSANFRTTPSLVRRLNKDFESIFAEDDGSGVSFSPASPAREKQEDGAFFELHLRFAHNAAAFDEGGDDAGAEQLRELVKLIREYQPAMNKAHAGGEKFRVAVLARSRNSLAPIADALHEAGIRFRAVDLEKLAQRQEVLDALALARALLNPQDRLAWLGVLRAPWCGLGLEDLHALAGGDDALVARPVPDLLRERQSLLSDAGRAAARRMMDTLDGLAALGGRHPIATLGTWLQQVWARLGGDDCYDATARGNLALLWNCLDRLAAGPEDLLGPALEAALEDLTALPDPHASIECGVQLMTIHKSKGLEFEVVIVPDLQAKSAASKPKLLSWLERGLPPDADNGGRDDADGITEFLIAPLSLKGSEKGRSKAWVDHEYNQREAQEMRRILYVAATRAREELHLFARPGCKVDASGEWILAGRAGLLSTAWPALKEEVEARFAAWKSTLSAMRDSASGQVVEILTLAASAEGGPFLLPSTKAAATAKPTRLRRLPVGYPRLDGSGGAGATSAGRTGSGGFEGGISSSDGVGMRLFDRLQGGVRARAMGTAVHALLEELARLRSLHEWDAARAEVRACEPRIAAQIRSLGIPLKHAEELSGRALRIALAASRDAAGAWILSPHPQAASEVRWSGVMGGGLQSVQADRVFRAGLTPGSGGDEAWWIVDYKTHAEGAGFEAAGYLASLRKAYAAQLEMYAAVLRNLHGEDARIRAAIYYPSMLLLDWWEV